VSASAAVVVYFIIVTHFFPPSSYIIALDNCFIFVILSKKCQFCLSDSNRIMCERKLADLAAFNFPKNDISFVQKKCKKKERIGSFYSLVATNGSDK